jgi:hypothetical protein
MTTKVTSSVLSSTGVSSGTYGGTTAIPVITVGSDGRLTYVANTSISVGVTTIISDDNVTSTPHYPLTSSSISGALSAANTSSATLYFYPSSGLLSANSYAINGTSIVGNNREHIGFRERLTTVGTVTATTYNLDLSLGNIFDVTLSAANVAFTFINPPPTGVVGYATVILRQDGSGNRTAAFTNARYTDGVSPVLSTNANAIDMVTYMTVNGGSLWMGSFVMANVS